MAKSTKTKKVYETSFIKGEEVKLAQRLDKEAEYLLYGEETEKSLKVSEELTEEQKLLNYIANSHSEKVDLVPLLKSLYPLPIYSQPATWLEQGESKRLRLLIGQMVDTGKMTMADDNYKKLGKHFYIDNDTKTKYHTIESLKIIAVK